MLRINLLPWRALKYDRAKKQYITCVSGIVVAALFIALIWHIYLGYCIRTANSRITELNNRWQTLRQSIQHDKIFEQQYNDIFNAIEVIKELHINKYKLAYFFNHIPELLPDGVRLRDLRYRKKEVELLGYAKSNKEIVEFMDNIKNANWIMEPNLEILSNDKGGMIAFQIKANLPFVTVEQLKQEEHSAAT